MISQQPYSFSRVHTGNAVVVGLDMAQGQKTLEVGSVFPDGTTLTDSYSGSQVSVEDGKVTLDTPYDLVLLSK